jgi:phosphosulfolactate synthase
MEDTRFFGDLEIPERTEKPRDRGITMMIDWGLGPVCQDDVSCFCGDYIDLAKVAVGIPRMIGDDELIRKNAAYRSRGIDPFPGGMLLEYAMHSYRKSGKPVIDAARRYYEESVRVGFSVMEVSDNVIEISPDEKREVISLAAREFGYRVLGEVGTKREETSAEEMIADVQNCIEAGSWKVLLEAAEFVDRKDGSIKMDLVEAIMKRFSPQELIFEIPGPWNPSTTLSKSHEMKMSLVDAFGPEVSLGNILPDDVLELETLRLGLGVGMHLD